MTDQGDQIRRVQELLPPWFEQSARKLPWRGIDDPYRIWLSEVMLQQTRVDQARPYYEKFVDKYPSIEDLALADRDELMRDWEGLGYYARARNVHRAALMVVNDMGGRFPDSRAEIMRLPGVGSYTAAAVLSIAFDEPLAVVDGNVTRVISRLFEVGLDQRSTEGRRAIQRLANDLLVEDRPGAFNEAMMELGATICTPRQPACDRCPIAEACRAFANDTVPDYPPPRRRRAIPHHEIALGIICDRHARVFIQQRPENGLLGGLWEFPGGKIEEGETPEDAVRREVAEETGATISVAATLPTVKHAYSHFTVRLHPCICRLIGRAPSTGLPFRWASVNELNDYAFPRANRRIIDSVIEDPNLLAIEKTT